MKSVVKLAVAAVIGVSGCMSPPIASPNSTPVPAHVDNNLVPLTAGSATDQFSSFTASVNTYRAPSLNPLAYNTQLQGAAQTHANNMSNDGFFSHTGSDGSMPWDRVTNQGYDWAWVGENIARGQTTANQALGDWRNSPGHNAILLSSQPTEFGLAWAPGNYWVMVLAKPGS